MLTCVFIHHLRHVLMTILALTLLAGCGIPDQPIARSAAAPPTQNQTATPAPTFDSAYYVTHPEVWPTLSPSDYTAVALKQESLTAVAHLVATHAALSPAPQNKPRPIYPTTPPVVGILDDCYGVNAKTQFATWSCWQERDGARTITVRAGGESGAVQKREDPSQYAEDNASIRGGVFVCVYTPSDPEPTVCDPTYWRPEQEGRLKIIAAKGMRLTLESVIGNRYVFNVDTRQWEAAPVIPVPTARPLPTFTPLPTGPTATPAPVITTAAVRPVLECVAPNGNGSFTAFFGFKNDNTSTASIPLDASNRFTPAPADRGQPTSFAPGRQVNVFGVAFNGNTLVWMLTGPDGKTRTATASRSSTACAP